LRLRLVVPPFHLSLASFIVVRFQDKPPCHVTSLPNSRLYPVESTSLHEWQHGSATTNNNSKQQQQNDDDDNNNNRMQNNTLRCVDCRHCSLKTTRRDRWEQVDNWPRRLGERASGNMTGSTIHERAAEASDDERSPWIDAFDACMRFASMMLLLFQDRVDDPLPMDACLLQQRVAAGCCFHLVDSSRRTKTESFE
jgi:hypothetical protein